MPHLLLADAVEASLQGGETEALCRLAQQLSDKQVTIGTPCMHCQMGNALSAGL